MKDNSNSLPRHHIVVVLYTTIIIYWASYKNRMILNLIDYDKSPDEDDDDDDCFNLEGIEGKQKPKVVLSPLSKLRFGELSMTVVDKHKGFINERNLGCENGFSSSDSSESNSSILLQSFFKKILF